MSGFSSLLDQFKQATRDSAAATASCRLRAHPSSPSSSARPPNDSKRPRLLPPPPSSGTRDDGDDARRRRRRRGGEGRRRLLPTVPVRTIYVACPASVETGGPEALHQLCHAINSGGYRICGDGDSGDGDDDGDDRDRMGENNVRAYMLYLRERGGGGVEHVASSRARPSRYHRYDAPPATHPPGTTRGWGEDHLPSESTVAATPTTAAEGVGNGVGDDGRRRRCRRHSSEMVIWPECWTHLIDSLQPPNDDDFEGGESEEGDGTGRGQRFPEYQIAIWWLSVDNNRGRFAPRDFATRGDVLHLAQSAYAREHVHFGLRSRPAAAGGEGGNRDDELDDDDDDDEGEGETGGGGGGDRPAAVPAVIDLTEYVSRPSSSSGSCHPPAASSVRDVDVAYNPAKGMHYTDEIVRRARGGGVGRGGGRRTGGGGGGGDGDGALRFAPIGNGPDGRGRMTGEEVAALLGRSKVYIDFGPHPGMDRLPREAALAGCVVITNREGAAANDEDVPLPPGLKFRDFNVEGIHALLKDCCRGGCDGGGGGRHAEYVERMGPYVEWILGQEGRMKACVDKFIYEIVTRRVARKQDGGRPAVPS